MLAARLTAPGRLEIAQIDDPTPGPGGALIRVHAAAITRDELEWPVNRLPAIPSYEVSGVVAATGSGVDEVAEGDAVFALTGFDRNGAAAEYTAIPARFLAPKPKTIGHTAAAAIPLAGLTAWQGLFVHGGLLEGERVLILGAAGGVGHLAVQLARWRGARVVATASGRGASVALDFGAHEVHDPAEPYEAAVEPVDLVFDTVGGPAVTRSATVLREGGRLVSVAEEPPDEIARSFRASYFVVEPDRGQLAQLARLVDREAVRPAIDSVYPLTEARAAFERLMTPGKHGKVVLEVIQ